MEVITLEEEAFYKLIAQVVKHLKTATSAQHEKWVNAKTAMRLLNITSPTTLQKFKNEGKLRFSQPTPKIVLYDRDSILQFIESNAQDTFQLL